MKTTKILLALVAGLFLMSGTAFAFHDGGVAHCDGCHSMHNTADNPRTGSATSANLMKGSDASSTCLNCHNGTGGYHVSSTVGDNMKAGGDFFWVKPTSIYDTTTSHYTVPAPSQRGHNVIAADFGLVQDDVLAQAPGGTYPANTLGCTSCHDPHGQKNGGTANGGAAIIASGSYGGDSTLLPAGETYGNYRILNEDVAAAPVARANGSDGASVDYGSGMSTWCAGCHTNFNTATNMHPVNVAVPVAYNAYVKTGDFTGDVATAYDPLVPFERGVTNGALLDETSTAGVSTGTEVVMCLSCHRAHASAFANSLRWDNKVAFMPESAILNESTTTLVANGAIPYYANGVAVDVVAKYGEYQRQLCNKCHVKD